MKIEKAGPVPGVACVIKKYPNRRLYDTCASAYVTLSDIRQRVLALQPFEVRDAKTGQDITRGILLQIILESEAGPAPMLSTEGLAGIIRLYGHAMRGDIGDRLERNIRDLQVA
jgi:polyhydroxyalkanoate synthesis repressor PhaR